MHTDKYGLIVQADGDANDQLNRVGIAALDNLGAWSGKLLMLERSPGVFVRHMEGYVDDVSGDQLVPVYAYAIWNADLQKRLVKTLFSRFGFSQNNRTMNERKKKVPDLIIHRVLPMMARFKGSLIPRWFADLSALLSVAVALIPYKTHDNSAKLIRKTGDDVDQDVNMVNTLFAIMETDPTLVGKLAVKWYAAKRQKTLGVGDDNVEGGLRWYHRAASGGNPEVGEMQVRLWKRAKERANS